MNALTNKEAGLLEKFEDDVETMLETALEVSRAARAAAGTFPNDSKEAADLLRTAEKIDEALALPDREAQVCALLDVWFPQLRN